MLLLQALRAQPVAAARRPVAQGSKPSSSGMSVRAGNENWVQTQTSPSLRRALDRSITLARRTLEGLDWRLRRSTESCSGVFSDRYKLCRKLREPQLAQSARGNRIIGWSLWLRYLGYRRKSSGMYTVTPQYFRLVVFSIAHAHTPKEFSMIMIMDKECMYIQS